MNRPARRSATGSATVWVVCCCALLMVVAAVGTARAAAVLARHRAEAAADLAALAAAGRIGVAGDECEAAHRIARRNGARLRTCAVRLAPDGRSGAVQVRVEFVARLPLVGPRGVGAAARAARLPARSPADGSSGAAAGSGRGHPGGTPVWPQWACGMLKRSPVIRASTPTCTRKDTR